MNMRSIGTVTVSFGLVSIPAKVFSATSQAEAIRFNLLDKATGSRLTQQYVNAKGAVVPRENMVKGYEFSKDQYVIFTPEELKSMDEAGSHMAELLEFVPDASVDPVYFDKPYFLAPDVGGAKPYALLASALRASQRVGIGRWATRGKQHVVMIRAVDDGLVMQQLLYSTEVRSMKDLSIPQTPVKEAELKLAMQLIEAGAADAFNATQYTDDVAARIRAAVEKKVAGEEFVMPAEAPAKSNVVDLTAALQASLAAKPKDSPKKAAPKAKKAA